jgi:hypothetical protein
VPLTIVRGETVLYRQLHTSEPAEEGVVVAGFVEEEASEGHQQVEISVELADGTTAHESSFAINPCYGPLYVALRPQGWLSTPTVGISYEVC